MKRLDKPAVINFRYFDFQKAEARAPEVYSRLPGENKALSSLSTNRCTPSQHSHTSSMDFGISGTALAPTPQPRANAPSNARSPIKRNSTRPETADEVAVGSGLMDRGLSDVDLENVCRLQYARWHDLQEYVGGVGNEPDYWPNGLIKVRGNLLIVSDGRFIGGERYGTSRWR